MSLTTKTLRRGRRIAAGSLIAVTALTLSACQSGKDSALHSSAAAVSAAGNGQGGSSGAAGSSSGAGTKSADGNAANAPSAAQAHTSAMTASDRCTADNLSLSLGRTDIGAGNIHIPLVFTNKGKTSCSLRGFPGVSLTLKEGTPVGKPATRSGAAGGSVRLRPGQSAHAVLHTVNDGVSDTPCWSTAQLVHVFPPGSKEAMTAGTDGLRVCGGEFDVTSVKPGATD
ncbi:DUF4232 domain-containing protein [Streptomyces gilvosporeus]|uniref:Serine/threonine protein kinase n=1 Tax=Streptomyces gilvosporeus TaxID=553510 RepID=A0A1V0TLE5_9ACTN|nr:DUF4232 domain-containing protein [Streptomyces gilvosporeus]ARF53765.1 serine/threonine protein kinase [Streptomyces gilvosporeus]